MIYCVVPRDLAGRLHDPLRRHFRDDRSVEVIVERRAADRRVAAERRDVTTPRQWAVPEQGERRQIRSTGGRRAGERRAALVPIDPPAELPRRLRRYAGAVSFFERVEPSSEEQEDLDTARLVARIQTGDREAFGDLYLRYFDRVYGYLKVLLRDSHEAEDAAQQVFANLFEALPRYERLRQPFRAYLFVAVRNYALAHLKKQGRLIPSDPSSIASRREENGDADELGGLSALNWITDRDLLLFVERLPLAQRQVVTLRYMLDMTDIQIAGVLGRSREDVRALQYRAMGFLRARLEAIGRRPERHGRRARMRTCPNQAFVLRMRRFALR